jgi:O-antigen/teichoic acid export membrane protein
VKLVRNVGAGLINSAWTALVGLAVVPVYLKYLGIEAYGLIGFFATTQALFQILDMGMGPTINREIARCSAGEKWEDARNLLHSLGVIYWCVAIVIGLVMIVCAPLISSHWLKAKTLSPETITHAVMLMGLVVACRWPIGLYQGALHGLQRIALSSGINIAMVSVGALGAVYTLAFISPTVDAFFIWQASVGIVYALILHRTAWRAIGKGGTSSFSTAPLRSIWRFSASMMALTFSALIFSQLDKVLLSKLLSLGAFGQYVLAGVVASALGILISPFYNAIYPRFSAYHAHANPDQLMILYRLSGRLVATVLFPVAMIIALVAEDLIRLWTGNAQLAAAVAPLAALLSIGTAVHGTMYVPHALMLSEGKTWIPLAINLSLLVVMVPITIYFAVHLGALGGAIAWVVLHLLYVVLWTLLMRRDSGAAMATVWIRREIGVPLLVCICIGLVARYVLVTIDWGTQIRIPFVFVCALASIAATFAVSSEMRRGVFGALRAELGR